MTGKLIRFLRHEVREMIPVTIYFFVTFQLLVITKALILREYGIQAASFVNGTVLAVVVAHVLVMVDRIKLVDRYPGKPLIYNVLWKTSIYLVASLVYRYLEHLVHFRLKSASFAEANRRLFDEIVWSHFWGVHMWLLVLLLVFCAARETVRALGRDQVIRMFFGDTRWAGPARPATTPAAATTAGSTTGS